MNYKNWFYLVVLIAIIFGFRIAPAFCAEKVNADQTRKMKASDIVVKPVQGVAAGVKDVAEGTKDLITETAKSATGGPEAVVQGVGTGAQKAVDSTVKGAYQAATLGYGKVPHIEHEEPEHGEGSLDPTRNDPSKFKIKF